ncbi:MAG TPA: circularly permuted type 2 ATP-grasp protein, partial [Solirubrobacteraceae bacterium]
IVAAGIVPDYVIESAEYHEPSLAGHDLSGGALIAGLDVVRDRDGRFLVLEDNLRTPSGIAYVVAARELTDRRLPEPVPGRHGVDGAYALLDQTLRAAAPGGRADPLVAVLTDGPANSAWWEHRTIADRLGLALVGVADLEVADDGLYARIDGRPRRLDVVYRRTSEDRLRAPDGRPTDVGRVLEEPWLRGHVGLVNAFGAGVADDKLAHAYVPEMIRFYLEQEPLLPSVRTYDLAVPEVLEDVLSRIDELVVKPREGSGGNGVVIGPHADEADTAATAEAVRRRPEGYVAQELVHLSRHPTLVDGRLEPRHVDLRAFVFLAGERAMALPGGLTRVALDAGALVVNSSQNGGAKDTWVLS